jgi:hypothetical protein
MPTDAGDTVMTNLRQEYPSVCRVATPALCQNVIAFAHRGWTPL